MKPEKWAVFCRDYEVSDAGRLRRVTSAMGAKVGAILSPTVASNGYRSFKVRDENGLRRTAFIHHAVAACFLGPRPDGHHVNHRDGNKLNNRVSNLEYVTPAGNSRHAVKHGLLAMGSRHGSHTQPESVSRGDKHWTKQRPESIPVGEDASTAKLTEREVREIRKLREEGARVKHIAEQFNVSNGAIYHIVKRTTWRHVT